MGGLEVVLNSIKFFDNAHSFGVIVWILACVFFWSSMAKLRQPVLTAFALVDFDLQKKPSLLMAYALVPNQ